MKRVICFALVLLFALSCRKEEDKSDYYNADGSLLTWEQARDLTEDLWELFDFVVISKEIVPPSTRIVQQFTDKITGGYYSPAYDAWLIVMSPDPYMMNGFQIYHYVYVNAKTGEIYIDPIKREFGNESVKWKSIKLPQHTVSPTQSSHSVKTKSMGTTLYSNDTSNKWAVVISGGWKREKNFERYYNDCVAMYRILVNKYGYKKDHIFLSVSDGTSAGEDLNLCYYYQEDIYGNIYTGPFISTPLDYDGDGEPEPNIYPATEVGVRTLFSALGQNVGSSDDVFIFVTDHGLSEGDVSYIALWEQGMLSPAGFNAELNKLQNNRGRINIVMGQCFSGGFISSISRTNVSIATAASAYEVSYGMERRHYEEFLYHWMAAVNGFSVDVEDPIEANIDGFPGVSFYEAFQYAKDADGRDEHPQYRSNLDWVGKICTLGNDQIVLPVISGPDKVSYKHSGTYSIQNLPEGATVTWEPGPELLGSSSSAQASYHYSGRAVFEHSTLSATISTSEISFQLDKINVGCWGCGNYEVVRGGSHGYYELPVPAGAYGFTWGCDANWTPLYQNFSYVNFRTKKNSYPSIIWCDYYTPLGDRSRGYMRCESYGHDPLGSGKVSEELNEL